MSKVTDKTVIYIWIYLKHWKKIFWGEQEPNGEANPPRLSTLVRCKSILTIASKPYIGIYILCS